jgi:hypothetical protein
VLVFSAPNFQRRGLHDSLTHTSIIQFCVGTRAVCERWCRWASFESLSFLFSATGSRSSISFRPYRGQRLGALAAPSQSAKSPCASAQKHAAAQVWLLLWRRGVFAHRTTLAPRSDRDSIDFFVVRALDETHNAVLPHQIAGLAKSIFFRSKGSANRVPVQSTIEIMRGPVHAMIRVRSTLWRAQRDVQQKLWNNRRRAHVYPAISPLSRTRTAVPSRMTRTIGSSRANEHSRRRSSRARRYYRGYRATLPRRKSTNPPANSCGREVTLSTSNCSRI